MKFSVVNKDLFRSRDKDSYIVHCISADYVIDGEISEAINRRHDLIDRLIESVGYREYPDCILLDNILTLVIKQTAKDVSSYDDMENALKKMRDIIEDKNIKDIVMPPIGCGKDGLGWTKVHRIIRKVLGYLDIKVTVYY